MRRQKRSIEGRMFTQGYRIGLKGRSLDNCPYAAPHKRAAWLGGWREGRSHYLSGTVFPFD